MTGESPPREQEKKTRVIQIYCVEHTQVIAYWGEQEHKGGSVA